MLFSGLLAGLGRVDVSTAAGVEEGDLKGLPLKDILNAALLVGGVWGVWGVPGLREALGVLPRLPGDFTGVLFGL